MNIEFKFDLGSKVKNSIGGIGIITALLNDTSGNQYYVKTSDGGNYWEESMLEIAPINA